MLVRQLTHEIELSKKNEVINEIRQQREYMIKRKVYNFALLDDQDEKRNSLDRKQIQSQQKQRENSLGQTQKQGKRGQSANIDQSQIVSKIGEKSYEKYSQMSERIEKRQSYCLLKCLGVTLVILILMTIFQEYAPNSHFNLLRFLKSPYGNSANPQQVIHNVNNDI